MTRRLRNRVLVAGGVWLVVACGESPAVEADEQAVLLSTDLPFRYPPELMSERVEGDVGLRLFVDSLGLVVVDSTRVAEPSSHPAFDSAAVAGAPYLQFRPARRGAARVGQMVLLPVRFRLPPADTSAVGVPGAKP